MIGAIVLAAATLVGPLNFPPAEKADWPFTLTRVSHDDLDTLRGSGLYGIGALVGGRINFTDANGCFSFRMWKRTLVAVDFNRVKALVRSGELRWVWAMDEPHDWPVCGPTYEDINAACALVTKRWHTLKCGINAPSAWLKAGLAKMPAVTFLFTQYSLKKGEPNAWAAKVKSDLAGYKGDLFLSIQTLDPRMTVEQARATGLALCNARPTGVTFWRWDDPWWTQPSVPAAMRDVAAVCAGAVMQ